MPNNKESYPSTEALEKDLIMKFDKGICIFLYFKCKKLRYLSHFLFWKIPHKLNFLNLIYPVHPMTELYHMR